MDYGGQTRVGTQWWEAGDRHSGKAFLQVIHEDPNLATELKFAHAWFGPMNAMSWYLLAGIHMGIHRKQITAILERVV